MGCGSSSTKHSYKREGIVDRSKQELPLQGCGRGQQMNLEENEDNKLGLIEKSYRQSGEIVENSKPSGKMETPGYVNQDIIDHNNVDMKISISDIICTDIEDGSEAHSLLQSATVELLVEEGRKLINELNDMPLNREDMPENFNLARKLRLIYHNARYNIGAEFCKLYLDKIMDEGLFSCLTKVFRSLQKKWPEMFSKAPNPQEVFKPPLYTLSVSKFPRPEMAVASVWLKLNDTVLGTTDLHEGCRIRAAEEGVLEYLLMEGIPAMSTGEYPGVKVESVFNVSLAELK